MNEDMNKFNGMKSKKFIISLLLGSSPLFLIFFALFVSVFIVLGFFEFDSQASGGGYAGGGSYESGTFILPSTLLSKQEFNNQLTAAVSNYPSLQVFAENADDIYDIALSEGVNPELVVVRAIKEGFSPGTYYNYWGMGCTNTGGGKDCIKYSSFNEGVLGFVKNVSKYSSLQDMMLKYAYIGDYWYNPGSSSVGGCYYSSYIFDVVPSRVLDACSSVRICTVDNTVDCVATTDEDQMAYANWQVDGMLKIRDSIFDVKVPSYEYDGGGSTTTTNIMVMSDSDVWYALTGYSSSVEANSFVTKNNMDSRMVTIPVPIRTWSSNDPDDYSTKKSTIKITVNRELVSLFTNFFTDIYNETGSSNDLFVINSNEVGCYNYRKSTSGSRLSAHSYGAACDINWSTTGNGYGEHVYTRNEWLNLDKSKSKYQIIYKDSKVAEIARRYTLSWGGNWRSVTDAMHFSFIGDETRSTLQSRS